MTLKFAFLVFVSLVSLSSTANILAVIPTPSYSHQIAFTALWKELSLRGHSVTVITTDPQNDSKLTNLTEIDVRWAYTHFTNITAIANSFTLWNMVQIFAKMSLSIAEAQLSYPPIQDLIRSGKQFDVVLVEHLFAEFLGFAEIFKCPKVLIASLDTWSNIHRVIGNSHHPVLYPEIGTPFYGTLSFKERLISTLYSWHVTFFHSHKGLPDKQELLHKYFNTTKSLDDILNDIDLLILNVNPIIQGIRAIGPTTINIGGYRPSLASPAKLPKDLQEYLDGAKNGFIYFSLGSNVKSKELSGRTLNSLIGALGEVPYKVLWKFEADTLPGKPSNVKLVKWAPQQQVLAHRNIKLFVTQGGLQSMEEGIYNEVPFVVIPHFGDQEQNANIMRAKGIARIVDKDPFINKDDLKTAILEVIQNPSYKTAVQNLKRLTLDNPMTGMEKAVWWIEHVIRNNGTKHLRNPTTDLPLYQYYLLDVIGFLITAVVLVALIIILTLKLSIRWIKYHICSRSVKLKEQ